MNNKNFIIFGAIVLLLVVIASIALNKETQTVTNEQAGIKLFPGLSGAVNEITQITSKKGDQAVTVSLNNDNNNSQWQVKENDNYQANLDRVKRTILSIANLEIVESKTRKPENYKKLEVEDNATTVTLHDAQGQQLASVILGKVTGSSFSASAQAKMYVRKAGDAQVWLVKGELHADPMAVDWLQEELMDIKRDRIHRVDLKLSEKDKYSVVKQKADDDHFSIDPMPKGSEIKSETDVDDMAIALQNLRLIDVVSENKIDFKEADTMTTEYQTFDGLVISAKFAKKDNKSFVKLAARFDPAIRIEPKIEPAGSDKNTDTAKTDPHAAKPATPKLKELAAVQQEAVELNDKLSGWAYVLPQNKIDLMTKPMAELLKE